VLQIELKDREFYDERSNKFFTIKGRKLTLEHSLISISKWEAHYKKFFFSREPRTPEESRYYVKCMTITQNVPPETYYLVTDEVIEKVNEYINDPMTATTIKLTKGKHNGEQVSSELIYYWMIEFGIPFKCEKWHFGRLWALIAICSEKQKPARKMSRSKSLKDMVSMNESRLRKLKK